LAIAVKTKSLSLIFNLIFWFWANGRAVRCIFFKWFRTSSFKKGCRCHHCRGENWTITPFFKLFFQKCCDNL